MSRKKILVVDDKEGNRRLLDYRLRTIGDFEILMAANGQEALELVSREPLDLIFMDLKLPVLDGWETVRRIRAMESPMRDVPIIALTAHALSDEGEKALAAGCDDFIAKPITRRSLIQEKAKRLLANSKAKRLLANLVRRSPLN
jgi:CheY-like chemotaxis protein